MWSERARHKTFYMSDSCYLKFLTQSRDKAVVTEIQTAALLGCGLMRRAWGNSGGVGDFLYLNQDISAFIHLNQTVHLRSVLPIPKIPLKFVKQIMSISVFSSRLLQNK